MHRAALREQIEDFYVEEKLGYDLAGTGQHICFYIEKKNLNTTDVINRLIATTGVRPRDIGYCGLKDKRAVTRQWISVDTARQPQVGELISLGENVRVLRRAWHTKKLRIGGHQSNRFRILLRRLDGNADTVNQKLSHLLEHGFPNYFAEQRFGRNAQNLVRAKQLFADEAVAHGGPNRRLVRVRGRTRSLWLSAARSHLFNQVLASRVDRGTWLTPAPDERYMLDGSNSFFQAAIDSTIMRRLIEHDIHTSGPLWGTGNCMSDAERDILRPYKVFTEGLENTGVQAARRALRANVGNAQCDWISANTLALSFTLARGCYATAFLREIISYDNTNFASNLPSIHIEQSKS